MVKATFYLPQDLKAALERAARAQGCSESQLVREVLKEQIETEIPAPRIPLFKSEVPDLAERSEELLKGFGET